MASRGNPVTRSVCWKGLWLAGVFLLLPACGSSGTDTVFVPVPGPGGKTLQCVDCHISTANALATSLHQETLDDVAEELAGERAGETPEEVLHGDDPENCIACHSPTSVLANDGMSEVNTLLYFFTTVDGKFTDQTVAQNDLAWPHVTCEACHDAPSAHPDGAPHMALFDSRTASYTPLSDSSDLCGQCHGSLRFGETDHLTYDAWAGSGHGDDQQDVADELAEERAGETPHEVVTGDDPENCIACHAPTAVRVGGGMNEVQALDYFFTTTDGAFTGSTAIQHTDEWPDVACDACHDPHAPDVPAYFNSSTHAYEPVADADALCGRCHGSLRIASTDHLSYDVREGDGGIGVDPDQLMPSVACVDCHMHIGDVDGSNSSMFHGHAFAIEVAEDVGETVSCTHCHPGMDAGTVIEGFQAEFDVLHATAAANVEAAAAAMVGNTDPVLLDKLEQAAHNLALAEGDESGGFHNHDYLMALVEDANARALEILAALD